VEQTHKKQILIKTGFTGKTSSSHKAKSSSKDGQPSTKKHVAESSSGTPVAGPSKEQTTHPTPKSKSKTKKPFQEPTSNVSEGEPNFSLLYI